MNKWCAITIVYMSTYIEKTIYSVCNIVYIDSMTRINHCMNCSKFNCNNCKYSIDRKNYLPHKIKTYRCIVEKRIKRKLTNDELIHHIDGNHNNNTLRNLYIFNRSDHSSYHMQVGLWSIRHPNTPLKKSPLMLKSNIR